MKADWRKLTTIPLALACVLGIGMVMADSAEQSMRRLGEQAIEAAEQGDHARAVELLEQAEALHDDEPRALYVGIVMNLATAYERLGRGEDAQRVLNKALGSSGRVTLPPGFE